MNSKTVLISIFDGNMVRNILRTDVLTSLVENPAIGKVVLLVHPLKEGEYRKEFEKGKVVIDTYPKSLPSRLESITWFIVRHSIHTKNVRSKINELLFTSSGGFFARLAKCTLAFVVFYSTKVNLIDKFSRFLAKAVARADMFAPILEKHTPDMVFVPTTFGTNDIRLLKCAKKKRVPTIGMIKSWDNLIGKDPLLIWPERLVVHNEIVKEYARNMHGFPDSRIYVSGIPQMDIYTNTELLPSRDAFFLKYGLDPAKPLVVYAAVGKLISYHEAEIIPYLGRLITSERIIPPSQMLVRLHPAYPNDESLFPHITGMRVVRPGKVGVERNPLRFDFEFDTEETIDLMATLAHADVLVQSGSTMAIDAACFDTPIISLGFDGPVSERLERSARRLLIKDHFKLILATGGTKDVYTEDGLVSALTTYLKSPETDKEGRARIVREQCYKLDGMSGRRIGTYLGKCLAEGVAIMEK